MLQPVAYRPAGLPTPASWLSAAGKANALYAVNLELAQAYKAQGNWFSQQGDYAQAVAYYDKALDANPAYSDAWFNLATLHRERQAWPKAITAYERVLALNPQDGEAALHLAECYDYNQQPTKALQSLDRVLTLQPRHDVASRRKAWLMFRLASRALDTVKPGLATAVFTQKERMAFDQAHNVLQTLNRENGLAISPRLGQVSCMATPFEPGSPSLAEYDAPTDSIRVIPELLFANPSVLAAYLAHEYVHANDRDSFSDVDEEMRGYLASIQVWLVKKGLLIEPNLDYATTTWQQQGDAALKARIEQVYRQDRHLVSQSLARRPYR